MMIFTLAAKELRSLFLSPLAWAILVATQGILAYFFLIYLDYFVQMQAQMGGQPVSQGITEAVASPLFATAAIVLLIVVPLLSMRLMSEERRNQTLCLLLSAPLSMTEIILGKYLGSVAFLSVSLLLTGAMPLSLTVGTTLDYGLLFSAWLGLFLVVASFAAVGLFISSLTNQPAVAAIGSFAVLLLLWILDLAVTTDQHTSMLSYLSMLRHYQDLLQGSVNSSDILFYLLFITSFLVLSIRRLDAERFQQ